MMSGRGVAHTETGLVRASLIYSATEIGPVALILEARCFRRVVFDSSFRTEELQRYPFCHTAHGTTINKTGSVMRNDIIGKKSVPVMFSV